jgi:hypothetical protein
MNEPLTFDQYNQVRFVGIDETDGQFGEVNLWQCERCGQHWLHSLVEFEAFRKSGRYFMGLITPETAERLSRDRAVDYLNQLDWYLYGGSYFDGKKGKSKGEVHADL